MGVTEENGDVCRQPICDDVEGETFAKHLLRLGDPPGLCKGSKSNDLFIVAQAIVTKF